MSPKQPTIKEIAKKLNISISTVSRALHDHPSIGLRTKIMVNELAKELEYEPNQSAIFFQQGKTFTIGVILPELSEYFFSTAISGIEDAAFKKNYTVLIGQSHDVESREKQIVETMQKHRVDGLLISLSKNTENYDHFHKLKKYNIPVVFFDRIPAMDGIHYVTCNLESGTIQAVNFLLDRGHRVIGMVNGPSKLYSCVERLEGYIKALEKRRIKYDPNLVINSDLTLKGTEDAMRRLFSLRKKPTALVIFNDYVTLDAVQYARKMKFRVNKDIAFVSYANIPISQYTAYPPMASVEQFPYMQGQKATETLLELLTKNSEVMEGQTYYRIILDSQLVVNK